VQDGNLNISCFLPSSDKGTIQLFDMAGKLMFEKKTSLAKGENMLQYSLLNFGNGTYFLRMTTSNSVWNQKVLFE